MDNDIKVWLYDILQAINEIDSYFIDNTKEFKEFAADLKTKRAIERNLAIIGEATSRIHKKNPGIQLTDARKIVDTRNRIVHGYDSVSDIIIWNIVTISLPKLKEEAEKLLGE